MTKMKTGNHRSMAENPFLDIFFSTGMFVHGSQTAENITRIRIFP